MTVVERARSTLAVARFVIYGTVPAYPDGSNPEGVAVDGAGNVYGAVVSGGGAFLRSVRR